MKELLMYIRIAYISFGVIVITAILWLVLPNPLFIQGLLLGMLTSLFNALTLILRTFLAVRRLEKEGKRSMATGMVQRLLFVGFAVYIAVKFPHIFSEIGVLVGLFLVLVVTLLYTVLEEFVFRNKKSTTS